jgi:transcriptional regulator with XRE-family HTH domain
MQKLIDLRLERGMTQEALAKVTGISLRTIQRIEQGRVKPRAYSLKKIADALKVDLKDLIQTSRGEVTSLSTLFTGDQLKVSIEIFYSVWGGMVFILLLLVVASLMPGIHFLDRSLFFHNDFYIIRSAITLACVFALIQIYLLLVRKKALTSTGYWILLILFSALPMYLKYTGNFVNASYVSLNNIQFFISFICWLLLLFLGVSYKSLFNKVIPG